MRIVGWLVLAIGVIGLPRTSGGQRDSVRAPPPLPARLSGKVTSSVNGKAVSGVMIAVQGTQHFQVTDSTGAFNIGELVPGRHVLAVRYGDRVSEDYGISLRPGQALRVSILIDIEAVDLDAVIVEADVADRALTLAGFYARRDKGVGRFLTREDILHRNPRDLPSLFAGTGVRFSCRRGVCVPVRSGGGASRCQLAVFLDGLWVRDYDLSWIPPQDVQAIEVYRQAETPAEFARSAMECGALLVWTRHR